MGVSLLWPGEASGSRVWTRARHPVSPSLWAMRGVVGTDPAVTYRSSVWRDSVVGATTGTLGGLGAIQEGRALWPWLGPAGLWPGAARLGSYSLGSADGHRLPVPHPHTGPSPTRPALEGQEDRMGPAPKLPKPRQV